ncbi:Fic family protein [Ruminococcaceae bacterium OttesenSCG-928-A11]|nr:Fic family protein [Ruminococcaceae bacterium OttesenSCG-928-A11]
MSPSNGHYNLESDGRWIYHAYTPSPLTAIGKPTIDDELATQLIRAHHLLGKLSGMFCYIPDMDVLSNPLAHREAKLSCEIEMQEALYNERFNAEPLKTPANKMTATYSDSLLAYTKALKPDRTAVLDFVRDAHRQIFCDEYDGAGQFRTVQLFSYPKISSNGSPIYNPTHPNEMGKAIKDLNDYTNTPSEINPLVKIALVHYQLATIKPFLIGNGLAERLCVNFLLVYERLLPYPLLCLSEYLLAGDVEYRDSLRLVRDYERDYSTWIKFFLKTIIIAVEKTIHMLDVLYRLRLSDLERIQNSKKCSPLLLMLYEYLWKSPIIETSKMVPILNVSYNTVAKAVDALRYFNVLEPMDSKVRYRRFVYRRLTDVAE